MDKLVEEKHLEKTLAIAENQMAQAKLAAEGKSEEIMEAKRRVREEAVHSVTSLYSSDGFEALVEMSQFMNPVTEGIADYEEEKRKIFRLEKLIQSPYFARIDFVFDGEEEAEEIYIGRSTLKEKSSGEMYIYDWRSPIASVFYRFMTGKAYYDAPGGTMEGEVTRKRQYEISDGKLEYFFDADRNISDEFLRQMLSKNTSPQMKAIVETIQREQDVAIRDMDNDLLMVQGVAGSGKTSIALHRAAYRMYQGLQSKLSADNILIVSPNTTFEQYISKVLPELGEDNVDSVVFDELLNGILRGRAAQTKNDFLEHAVTNNSYKEIVKNSIEFKTSKQFREILDQFVEEIPLRKIRFEDMYHKGKCIVEKETLRNWVMRRPEVLLGTRLTQLEDFVLEKIFGTVRRRGDAEERNWFQQEIQTFTRLDLMELYKSIFYEKQYFECAVKNGSSSEMVKRIWDYTRENLESGRLYYDNAIAIAYLYLKIFGSSKYRNIKQVVIDEAQDYYPLQFEIFRILFPNAKFTVLGDINQTLGKQENLSFYEQIQKILDKKQASLITLDKSFRCTNEILNFSLQFMERKPEIESFNRKGEEPKVLVLDTHAALLDTVVREVELCKSKGYKTICLICKTEKNVLRFYRSLKSKMELQLIKERKVESLEGTFIMPVYMSKGLEFDAVILCDVNAENYFDEDDKNLLYVECTRALHRLNLFCEGKLSPLIAEKSVDKSDD